MGRGDFSVCRRFRSHPLRPAMSESIKAVFLCYASEVEAARRIAEALRCGGGEVWIDADGGLEHGDEWDAKLRSQIKECVLFMPTGTSPRGLPAE